MAETYNNVPMDESLARKIEKSDKFWTGPRLVGLTVVTLGGALVFLWMMANNIIGPTIHQ